MNQGMSRRTFGVEIECLGLTQDRALAALTAAGLNARVEYLNHETRKTWKITTDSSVYNPVSGEYGIEIVSPILKGKAGLKALRAAATALETAGATINKSCGLHVHVGAKDLTVAHIDALTARYAAHENVIDAFMPVSRRQSNNSYCISMENWRSSFVTALRESGSVESLANRIYTRYHKINVSSYLRHGTVEFRQHSGTVNAEKIENWVLFLLNFVEQSISQCAPAPAPVRPVAVVRAPAAHRVNDRARGLFRIVALLRSSDHRFHGRTPDQLAAASGYSVSSIPACLTEIRNRWNLSIKKDRRYNVYVLRMSDIRFMELSRQYGTLGWLRPDDVRCPQAEHEDAIAAHEAGHAAFAPFTVRSSDSPFRGLSPKLVSYFTERTMDLSGTC